MPTSSPPFPISFPSIQLTDARPAAAAARRRITLLLDSSIPARRRRLHLLPDAPAPTICTAYEPLRTDRLVPLDSRASSPAAPLLPPPAHALSQTGRPEAPPPPVLRCRAMPLLRPPPSPRTLGVSGGLMRRRLIRCCGLPVPPRTLGVSGGRLLASLPLPPPIQSPREVHVWYICPDELNNHSQLNMYEELLSPAERKHADSMNGATLRKDAILSRALLRTTLSKYTGCKIDPRSFEFKKNKFGKPEVLWPPDDSTVEQPLHFNISHTTSLIACGIAMHAHIGIDIEEKKRNTTKNILSLARRYFTPSEVDYLAEISDSNARRKEFLKLWTLKEAYVKALGMGFSGAPFNTFSIMLETSKGIQISKALKACSDSKSGCVHLPENWLFTVAELNSSHYMSVCLEDRSRSQGAETIPVQVGLKVWKTVPFVKDTLVSGTEAVKVIA